MGYTRQFASSASARFVTICWWPDGHDRCWKPMCWNAERSGVNPVLKRSFGLMLEALDDLKEDEVYVCSGSSPLLMPCGAS